MSPEIISIVRVVRKEVWHRRRLMVLVYVLCSAMFLVAALVWPKVYTSSSTIFVDRQNILRPLMAGTAETTEIQANMANMANKIIFSQRSLKRVLDSDTWSGDFETVSEARALDRIGQRLSATTRISNVGANLIEISYTNNEPIKAFETAQLMTEIFIEESVATKQRESQAAYNFIDEQVNDYHEKLKSSENAIKEFRSKNIDASETAKDNANARLIELKRELETVELDISTGETSVASYKKQLTGESSFTDQASIARESQLNERLVALEQRLADLKLNYHDSYPDIVQLKSQIGDVKKQIQEELTSREARSNVIKVPTGETAQLIQSQIFTTQNNINALKARKKQISRLMDNERTMLDRISDVEAEVSELTRDYEVNQEMYQNLLNQRENARISMNIDLKNQGLTLKVQEPPSIPVTPKGIRFAHIVLAGLALSFMIPVGLIYGLTLIDQKIRTEPSVYNTFEIPVLASVDMLDSPSEKRGNMIKFLIFVSVVVVVWAVYGFAIFTRMQG